ncbi:uncharacterized protein LOC114575569 [Exaiptasia diaphana]|uniref:Alpha-(1,6)-fucosyltransferase N- and catalytic domain-containing protein n=1 Tax=Exaiptasia diaphana TaxID=2652724 RepID=A0A913YLY7_EXADI|nr:uncharacterized protein LOC114575569 [Exaiptasia diaphana]
MDDLFNNQVESLESLWYFAEQLERNPRLKERWRTLGLPTSTDPYTLLGCAVEILFRKSPFFEQQLIEAKSALKFSKQKPVIIGIHIRTDDLHWGDQNPYSVRTRSVETVRNCAIRVENVLKANFNIERPIMWFLASDDATVKSNWLKKHPSKVITQSFIPKHSEKHASKVTQTNTLTDIFLLSESDFMIVFFDSTYSNVAIGVGGFPVFFWVYGEYCNDINNKTLKSLVQNKTRHELIHSKTRNAR